jgi:very-short-patch-repair endonuclease
LGIGSGCVYRSTSYSFSLREKVRLRGNGKLTSKARLTHLAQKLRRNQADAEVKLWRALRSRQIEGAKFRRQFPIGRYIADFICLEARLVIEVDGPQHALQVDEDQERTEFLESKGLTVVRFTNIEVLTNLEGVVFAIVERLAA